MRAGRGAGDRRVVVSEFSVLGVPGGVVVPFSELGNAGKEGNKRDFPGDPVVKTPHFHCRGTGLIPCPGAKILHARAVITNRSSVLFMWLRLVIFFHLLDTFARYSSTMRKLRLRKVTCLSGASRI